MAALENESFCRCCGKCKMDINGKLICTDYLFYGTPVDNSLIFAGKEGGQQMLKGIYFDEREETEE